MKRRDFLATAAAVAATSKLAAAAPRGTPRTRLILLGTGGGPRPRAGVTASSQVIVVDDAAYVIDCGDGVARQLAHTNVPFSAVRHVFITHQHSDHNADYGNLLLLGWTAGLQRVDTWGPPPLVEMTRLFFEMNAADIDVRTADEGRQPLAPLVHPHEIRDGGVVLEDDRVKVTAALVQHPMVQLALAYRFDAPGRSIVISGDTAVSDALIRLARGADVLVHEAMYGPAIDRLVAKISNAPRLKRHILASHTLAEDAGRVAHRAGVGTLVLSHLIPADDPAVTEAMWLEAASKHFRGKIVVGRDLLEV